MIVLHDPEGSQERSQILEMLRTICPEGDVNANADGNVFLRGGRPCGDVHNVSCQCLCALLEFDSLTVSIKVNRHLGRWCGGRIRLPPPPPGWPRGVPIDPATLQPDGSRGPGVSPDVEIEPGDHYVAARADDPTKCVPEPDWLILAHELCGHAVHMMRGDATRDETQNPPGLPYPDNHRQATDAGAAIRAARGLPAIDPESTRRK